MRVTQTGFYNSATRQMQEQQAKVYETQTQLSSGKKIAKPSDDPALAAASNILHSQMTENSRYMTNLDRVFTTMQMQDAAVSSAVEQLSRIKTLSIQGANDSYSAADRKSVAIEIKELIAGLVDVANMRGADGAYVFSGYSQNEAPFSDTGGEVVYRGSHDYQKILVDEGRFMEVGVPGSAIFGSVHHVDAATGNTQGLDMFTTLNQMVTALQNADSSGIQSALAKVNSVHEHMVTQEATIGARMSRVDGLKSTLEERDFTFKKLQSELEDLDYVEAAGRLKNQTLALQAGQQTFTQLANMSLFQYIR